MRRYKSNQEHTGIPDEYGDIYFKGNLYHKKGKLLMLSMNENGCSVRGNQCICSCCVSDDKIVGVILDDPKLAELEKQTMLSSIITRIRDDYVRNTSTVPVDSPDPSKRVVGSCTRLTDIYIKDHASIDSDWTLAYEIIRNDDRECTNDFCRCQCERCKVLPFEMTETELLIFHQWLSYAELLFEYKTRYFIRTTNQHDHSREDYIGLFANISPWCLSLTRLCRHCNTYGEVRIKDRDKRVWLCLNCIENNPDYKVLNGLIVRRC